MSTCSGCGRKLRQLLACVRYDEVVVLQGPPLLGAVLALRAAGTIQAKDVLCLVLGNALLVAHVFLLNDWAGAEQDLRDPARASHVYSRRGIRQAEMLALTLGTLGLAMLSLAPLGTATLALAGLIAIASALYSLPGIHLKGRALASSLLHLVTGVLHFMLGYAAVTPLDGRALELGLYFATVFSAGHLTQEVRDHQADRSNGIQTHAVRFGAKPCFAASCTLFALANLLLVGIALRGLLPPALALLGLLFLLHLHWAVQAWRAGLDRHSVRRLQIRYRLLYAVIGLAMVGSQFPF
jgi:4-hydroxybenzoate polyprenyltransferase